jgi:hypothetical protein
MIHIKQYSSQHATAELWYIIHPPLYQNLQHRYSTV